MGAFASRVFGSSIRIASPRKTERESLNESESSGSMQKHALARRVLTPRHARTKNAATMCFMSLLRIKKADNVWIDIAALITHHLVLEAPVKRFVGHSSQLDTRRIVQPQM